MKAWEVWQNGQVVCSYRMSLTRQEALNKIANENRIKQIFGSWSIRHQQEGHVENLGLLGSVPKAL